MLRGRRVASLAAATGRSPLPADAAAQAVSIALDGTVAAGDGSRLAVRADTICIHGDSPDAVGIAQAVVAALGVAGIPIAARARDG